VRENAEAFAIDASVAVKWFFHEAHSEAALRIKQGFSQRWFEVFVPDLFFLDLANIIRFQPTIPPMDAQAMMEDVFNMELNIVPLTRGMTHDAMRLAHEAGLTIYDAAYVVVARAQQVHLVSADPDLIDLWPKENVMSLEAWHESYRVVEE